MIYFCQFCLWAVFKYEGGGGGGGVGVGKGPHAGIRTRDARSATAARCPQGYRRRQILPCFLEVSNLLNNYLRLYPVPSRLLANCSVLLISNYMTQFVISNVIHYITHFR